MLAGILIGLHRFHNWLRVVGRKSWLEVVLFFSILFIFFIPLYTYKKSKEFISWWEILIFWETGLIIFTVYYVLTGYYWYPGFWEMKIGIYNGMTVFLKDIKDIWWVFFNDVLRDLIVYNGYSMIILAPGFYLIGKKTNHE